MYQEAQKKFNLSAVVICNCFISLVNTVLIEMFFFYSGGINTPALQLVMCLLPRFNGKFLKCIHCVSAVL